MVAGVAGESGLPTPGPANSSLLGQPAGVAVDSLGDLFIADTGDDVVEEVTPAGRLSVISGIAGKSGRPTPGPAASSRLGNPAGVAVDSSGNVLIADSDWWHPETSNDVVERISAAGRLTIVAGMVGRTGPPRLGPATRSTLWFPSGVTEDDRGNVFISDNEQWPRIHSLVEKIALNGQLSVVAGVVGTYGAPTPGRADGSRLGSPGDIAVDSHGDLFIADAADHVVEKVAPNGRLSVIAGIVGKFGLPTPGPATSSRLADPISVAVDRADVLFIADADVGLPQVSSVVEEVTPAGRLSIAAGIIGKSGPPTPGPADSSLLGEAGGIAVDSHGDLFIGDSQNGVVEEVTPNGRLSVIAGIVGKGGSPTPGSAKSSLLGSPGSVAVDSHGDLFIDDFQHAVVEEVTPNGRLSVIAGIVGKFGPPTLGPAKRSRLGGPSWVAVDSSDNVFIADDSNNYSFASHPLVQVVEKVSPTGRLSVVAGIVGEWGLPTPGPANRSKLGCPSGVAVDGHGNLFISDSCNSLIEKVES